MDQARQFGVLYASLVLEGAIQAYTYTYMLQCDAIRSEQFENGQFSRAYNLWTQRLDKFWRNYDFG